MLKRTSHPRSKLKACCRTCSCIYVWDSYLRHAKFGPVTALESIVSTCFDMFARIYIGYDRIGMEWIGNMEQGCEGKEQHLWAILGQLRWCWWPAFPFVSCPAKKRCNLHVHISDLYQLKAEMGQQSVRYFITGMKTTPLLSILTSIRVIETTRNYADTGSAWCP